LDACLNFNNASHYKTPNLMRKLSAGRKGSVRKLSRKTLTAKLQRDIIREAVHEHEEAEYAHAPPPTTCKPAANHANKKAINADCGVNSNAMITQNMTELTQTNTKEAALDVSNAACEATKVSNTARFEGVIATNRVAAQVAISGSMECASASMPVEQFGAKQNKDDFKVSERQNTVSPVFNTPLQSMRKKNHLCDSISPAFKTRLPQAATVPTLISEWNKRICKNSQEALAGCVRKPSSSNYQVKGSIRDSPVPSPSSKEALKSTTRAGGSSQVDLSQKRRPIKLQMHFILECQSSSVCSTP
jgi:hypothetical protein